MNRRDDGVGAPLEQQIEEAAAADQPEDLRREAAGLPLDAFLALSS